MDSFNILFTSAGRRVSLLRSFRQSLKTMGLRGNIITADLNKSAPASFVADIGELAPPVVDPGYIEALKAICRKRRIKLVVPLIDTELSILADSKKDFEEIGVNVMVSSPEVNEISFDKRKTSEFFKAIGVQTPEILDPKEIISGPAARYPYLLKPFNGNSSTGVTKIWSAKELEFFVSYVPGAIVQELITGEEYTLDILADLHGRVRCVVPRLRIETRSGEISKGMTVKNIDIINAGKKVVEALPGAVGCITVQCFLTPGREIKFIEINPRFGGGIPLSIRAGADFPRWIIEMYRGCESEITLDGWKDGLVMLRYDDELFTLKEKI
ncbi:ATP-grasp domain-containing protein [Pelotomaculum propionicicum]|uniref:ATP-grasp domain-containing protein n=1 Tax=Pelotomaculum propionicicum TaxID=258475 RepID=UPI003B79C381